MICLSCNKELPSDSKYCHYCGTIISKNNDSENISDDILTEIDSIYCVDKTEKFGLLRAFSNFMSSEIKYLENCISTTEIRVNSTPIECIISDEKSSEIKGLFIEHIPELIEIKPTGTEKQYVKIEFFDKNPRYYKYNDKFASIFNVESVYKKDEKLLTVKPDSKTVSIAKTEPDDYVIEMVRHWDTKEKCSKEEAKIDKINDLKQNNPKDTKFVVAMILVIILAIGCMYFGSQYAAVKGELDYAEGMILIEESEYDLLHNYRKAMIDFYLDGAVVIEEDGDSFYHRYGCRNLDLSSVYIHNNEWAEDEGYKPCSICMDKKPDSYMKNFNE